MPFCRLLLALLLSAVGSPALGLSGENQDWQRCLGSEPGDEFLCLQELEVSYLGELDYELELARSARQSGNSGYAAIVLERVVARRPLEAGARVDLVLVSMEAGDLVAAARHLRFLESLPNPPPAVRALMVRLKSLLKPEDKVFDQSLKLSASLGVGYDTNPSLGIYADAVELVINGQPILLRPDQSLQPQPDFFAGGSASAEYSYSPRGLLSASAYFRKYEQVEDQDNLAVAVQAFHKLNDRTYFKGVLGDFRTDKGLYLSRAGAGVRHKLGCDCLSVGVLADVLYGSEDASDARRVTIDTDYVASSGDYELFLYSSLGYSWQPNAEWGNTLGAEVGFNLVVPLAKWRVNMGGQVYSGHDEAQFSPLFPDKKRDLLRSVARMGLSYRVSPMVELFADWTYSRQESDLILYEYKRQVSALGVKLNF